MKSMLFAPTFRAWVMRLNFELRSYTQTHSLPISQLPCSVTVKAPYTTNVDYTYALSINSFLSTLIKFEGTYLLFSLLFRHGDFWKPTIHTIIIHCCSRLLCGSCEASGVGVTAPAFAVVVSYFTRYVARKTTVLQSLGLTQCSTILLGSSVQDLTPHLVKNKH